MSETRVGHLRVTFTVMIALLFAITPLPASIEPARPGLLLLLVIYWSLSAPRIAGLTFAWLCGLAMDLLTGVVLGQHALAFLVVGFLTHKFQLRMRVFPIWHQTLTVFMLLALHQFLVFWIDGVPGNADMVKVDAPIMIEAGISRRGTPASRNSAIAIGHSTKKATNTETPP